MAEDADVDIQPITRADFVPAKVFRSRSMNTLTADVTMTRTELFEAPTSWNFSKICFIPRRYLNKLDAIWKVMY